MSLQRIPWFKSSYSGQNGECVEARCTAHAHGIDVRDSKNPRGPVLQVGSVAWSLFLADLVRSDVSE